MTPDKLDELATKYTHDHYDSCTDCFMPDISKAFKAGYKSRNNEVSELQAKLYHATREHEETKHKMAIYRERLLKEVAEMVKL